jgi:hypothetical protein
MINIGIDKNMGLVYEVDGHMGRPVWPTPVISPAKFIFPSQEEAKALTSSDVSGYRFREDSFDPIARIRRGRFYLAGQSQPIATRVAHHPGNPISAIARDIHAHSIELETFYGNPIYYQYIQGKRELPLVLLGVDDRFTSWTIISVEAIATGEDLVTLKARSSFGLLPIMDDSKVPEAFRAKLNEALRTFADEAHRSSPASVIDRARDVAVHALLAHFDLRKEAALDLGKLIKRLEDEGRVIAENVANIVARLHARAKPSEQEKRELRPVREQDADLAIQCIGTLLCEIGFAEWS